LVEPRNYRIEFRWAFDQFDRLPALAAELVGQKPAVIVTAGAGGEYSQDQAAVAGRRAPCVTPDGARDDARSARAVHRGSRGAAGAHSSRGAQPSFWAGGGVRGPSPRARRRRAARRQQMGRDERTEDGNYYLPATDEVIPADLATPSPDDRFHRC